jgi:hypothetical protein
MGKKTTREALHFVGLNHIRVVFAFTLVGLLTGKNNPWQGNGTPINRESTVSYGQH